jgi:hypothetical protein
MRITKASSAPATPSDQILDAHMRVDLEEHRRPAGPRAAVAPGVLRHDEFVVEFQAPIREFAKHQFGGHDLDRGGGRHKFVGRFFIENGAGTRVDQNRVDEARLETLRPRRRFRHEQELRDHANI